MSDSLWPHGLLSARLLCPWGFSRQEYWSGLPCPPPGNIPNTGIEPRSPTLQVDSLPAELLGKPKPLERITKKKSTITSQRNVKGDITRDPPNIKKKKNYTQEKGILNTFLKINLKMKIDRFSQKINTDLPKHKQKEIEYPNSLIPIILKLYSHRTAKGQFSFQSQRRAMPKNVQTIISLCLIRRLTRLCSKSFKLGLSSVWIKNSEM